jgi:hypothetical protein
VRRAALTLLVALGAGAGAQPALADPAVTITPPTGAGVRAYPNHLRTSDRQPVFGIAGSGGTSVRCNLDDAGSGDVTAFAPCGSALPGCLAQVCASFQPPAPLPDGPHALTVELDDATGRMVAQSEFDFVVDTTPPDTVDISADGPARRPTFSFTIEDDDLMAPGDTARCSFTTLSEPPLWSPCATGMSLSGGLGGSYRVPVRLPGRRADYRFLARSVDDFGRMDPTPAEALYNPVPCVLAVRARTLSEVIASGIPLTLSCTAIHTVRLEAFLLGANGASRPISSAVRQPALARQTVTGGDGRWSRHPVLRVLPRRRAALRADRSAAVVVRATALGTTRPPAYGAITASR